MDWTKYEITLQTPWTTVEALMEDGNVPWHYHV
jgi:hypothetical protein